MGYDAAKRIKGRKRHLLVDTLGPIPGVAVTPASTPERNGAQVLLGRVPGWFTWLPRRWVAERTLGWLMRQRRLVRDDEGTERSAEA